MPRPSFFTCLAILLLALGGCTTRSLTGAERAFSATVQGTALDTEAVRVTRGAVIAGVPANRPPRPYVTCRERIYPKETKPKVRWKVAGFVLGERLFVSRKVWEDDFLAGYPDALPLADAMFLAHEMTHVWQWQHRDSTGYAPWRAASEHGSKDDPYLYDLAPDRRFDEYGYEQQASLVGEFVCCRALDPDGSRTGRLYAILKPVFSGLERQDPPGRVKLPWKEAETEGICSR
ncbi:hypothetical protein [Tropicimonas sp. IMCC6043]|uniref:hypothetical protein n=1 Tax=Tropicimonas sp. IMCC6043 TaxID=2510645 RepID=UPI00101CE021|nr:hypothetical protein [Tropicimonas sp. IMCC6043]RYH10577.1 hypothetical protein EU800_07465 [Tropicimonas sp. IMCC6043]